MNAEQIVEQYPQRTLSEVYTVLAWYHANRDSFDKELTAEAIAEEQARQTIGARQS